VATVVEGAGGGVRDARREFPAMGEDRVAGVGGGGRRAHGAVLCRTYVYKVIENVRCQACYPYTVEMTLSLLE
jgi:hypothetical protein